MREGGPQRKVRPQFAPRTADKALLSDIVSEMIDIGEDFFWLHALFSRVKHIPVKNVVVSAPENCSLIIRFPSPTGPPLVVSSSRN